MCLIVFAWQTSKDYPLIVAANRDEFHQRPTQDAHWWPDRPEILAGRDLQAGGTWLAVGKHSRFAAITNYREPSFTKGQYRSRGELVTQFVAGTFDPMLPVQLGSGSRDVMRSLGYAVEWFEYPMQHAVCPEEITEISRWLNECFHQKEN